MAEVTHSSTSFMKGSADADHILDGSYGYTTTQAVVNVSDSEHDLYIDGQTIVSDGTFVIGTTDSKSIIFATDSTVRAHINTDGAFDLKSGKFLLNGTTGSANQVLKSDGYGNLSWTDLPTQQHAFGGIVVSGQDTVSSSSLSEDLTLIAGTGITLATDSTNKTVTITSSGGSSGNSFSTIAIGNTDIIADSSTDTLTLVAGDNITINPNASSDTITISANTSGETNQNAFTQVGSTGQSTITASQTSDSFTIDSEENTSLDSRYRADRDKVTVTTDTETNKVVVKNNIPKTFSMASKVPLVSQTGENAGVPLRNKFYNITATGLTGISGGGTSIGVSTRSLQFTNSSGVSSDVLMPAKSDNSTLQLTIEDSSGSTHTIDMDVAE
jgi:hypothetical protein